VVAAETEAEAVVAKTGEAAEIILIPGASIPKKSPEEVILQINQVIISVIPVVVRVIVREIPAVRVLLRKSIPNQAIPSLIH